MKQVGRGIPGGSKSSLSIILRIILSCHFEPMKVTENKTGTFFLSLFLLMVRERREGVFIHVG